MSWPADNFDTVRRALAALNARDVERYLALCAPDIELVSPVAAIEGSNVGERGVREFFAGLDEATDDYRFELNSLTARQGGRVLASLRLHMKSQAGVSLMDSY